MSRKLYMNHADKFFNVAGTIIDSNPIDVTRNVSTSVEEPATQPTAPTTSGSTSTSNTVSSTKPYGGVIPTETIREIRGVDTVLPTEIVSPHVVVVQPTPVISPVPVSTPLISTGGGGGGAMASEKKLTAPLVKNSIIKTYLLPLLIIGAGVYVYLKKPIKN